MLKMLAILKKAREKSQIGKIKTKNEKLKIAGCSIGKFSITILSDLRRTCSIHRYYSGLEGSGGQIGTASLKRCKGIREVVHVQISPEASPA